MPCVTTPPTPAPGAFVPFPPPSVHHCVEAQAAVNLATTSWIYGLLWWEKVAKGPKLAREMMASEADWFQEGGGDGGRHCHCILCSLLIPPSSSCSNASRGGASMQGGVAPAMGTVIAVGALAKERMKTQEHRLGCQPTPASVLLQN